MIFIVLTMLFFIFMFIILNKINIQNKNILRIILVVFALEIYIFNWNSFRLKFNNYEKIYIGPNNFILTDIEYIKENNTYKITGENPNIEINNIHTKVGTVKINMQLENVNKLTYNLYYTDNTSEEYRKLPEKVLTNNLQKSQYITCYLSGESSKLKISFTGEENTEIKIDNIVINEDIPFSFNFIRFFLISITIILVYKMLTDNVFSEPFRKENKKQTNIIVLIVLSFILIIGWMSITTPFTNKIHDEFVNSIINGKISLETEPAKELLEMDNPYDTTLRESEKVDYIWDIAYYNNHYYVYFGILPFLILSVPVKLLMGDNLPTSLGVMIFNLLIIINLTKILILLYKKWFNKISFNYFVLALIGTLSGSLIFWTTRRPDIYEFVLCSSIYFSTQGFYLMFKAIEKENINYKYLFYGTTCLSLSVACRPTQLLISLVFLPKLIKILIENIKKKENILKFICSAILPYLIVGILLMIYNYIRFDNVFEFGAKYQLTVNDMKHLKYRLLTIPVGIITQIFKLPIATNTFPFFIHQYDTISFFGYYYIESLVCGLFILNPINFILLFLIGLKKKIKEKEAYNYICIFLFVTIIICLTDIVLAGSLQRYSMDYAWLLNIASYFTLFIIVNNIKSKEIKRYILKISIVITLFMLFINFIVGGVVSESNLLEKNYPELYYNIRYSICFWE